MKNKNDNLIRISLFLILLINSLNILNSSNLKVSTDNKQLTYQDQFENCQKDYLLLHKTMKDKIDYFTQNEEQMLNSVQETIMSLYLKSEKFTEFYSDQVLSLNKKLETCNSEATDLKINMEKIKELSDTTKQESENDIKKKDSEILILKSDIEELNSELTNEKKILANLKLKNEEIISINRSKVEEFNSTISNLKKEISDLKVEINKSINECEQNKVTFISKILNDKKESLELEKQFKEDLTSIDSSNQEILDSLVKISEKLSINNNKPSIIETKTTEIDNTENIDSNSVSSQEESDSIPNSFDTDTDANNSSVDNRKANKNNSSKNNEEKTKNRKLQQPSISVKQNKSEIGDKSNQNNNSINLIETNTKIEPRISNPNLNLKDMNNTEKIINEKIYQAQPEKKDFLLNAFTKFKRLFEPIRFKQIDSQSNINVEESNEDKNDDEETNENAETDSTLESLNAKIEVVNTSLLNNKEQSNTLLKNIEANMNDIKIKISNINTLVALVKQSTENSTVKRRSEKLLEKDLKQKINNLEKSNLSLKQALAEFELKSRISSLNKTLN